MERESLWCRLRHTWRGWFLGKVRSRTPTEDRLVREVEDLQYRLKVREEVEEELRLSIRKLTSDVEASRHEVNLLGIIHEADRKRWERIIALESASIASAQRKGGSSE